MSAQVQPPFDDDQRPEAEPEASPATATPAGAPLGPGLVLGFLLAAFLVAFAYSGYVLYSWARGAVAGTPEAPPPSLESLASGETITDVLEASLPEITPAPVATIPPWDPERKERVNILLLGVDQRPSEQGPTRTDTIMVITIDPATGHVGMLSIPRDLWVRIPGYDVFGKINTAYVIGELRKYPGGAPALTKQTVSELIGYPIHYYVKINFDGFRRFIDLIGGIDIYVPRDLNDPLYPDDNYGYDPLFIPAGLHHMDGELALKFARTRHVDDDYGRARRQQQVILAVKEQVMRADMIPSLILRLPQLVQTFTGSVETDIPISKVASLADLARQLDLNNIQQVVIDRSLGEERNDPNIGFVLIPNRDQLRPLMDHLFGAQDVSMDQAAAQAATPTPQTFANATLTADLQIAAEAARIAVLDGNGNPQIAADVAERLRNQGFALVEVDVAPTAAHSRTLLRIFTRKPYTIAQLQVLFPQAEVQDLSSTVVGSPRDIEIVVGQDYPSPVSATGN